MAPGGWLPAKNGDQPFMDIGRIGDACDDKGSGTAKVAKVTSRDSLQSSRSPTVKRDSSEVSVQSNICLCGVILPEKSRFLRYWDMLGGILMIFICFGSPYEVAFLDIDSPLHPLWIFNRLVDVVFIFDMGVQFSLAYAIQSRYEVEWVTSRTKIAQRYLSRWFIIDLVSILPFDLMGFMTDSSSVSRLKLLRMSKIMRILRLLKLLRLFKGMRIFARWQSELGISQRRLTLWGLLVSVIVSAHWMSCLIGLVSRLQGVACGAEPEEGCVRTWISEALADGNIFPDWPSNIDPADVWLLALHTAVTITVHPHSLGPTGSAEIILFVLLMLLGGFIWTRVISRSTSISTSLTRHKIHFQQTMDDVHAIGSDMGLSEPLQRRMRDFFSNTRDASQRETWLSLQKRMSPQLRQAAAREINWPWVQSVPYLTECTGLMITTVTEALVSEMYAQKEVFGTAFNLYIISQGVAMRLSMTNMFNMLRPGSAWGFDHLLLKSPPLMESVAASAVRFVEVLRITRDSFDEILLKYPENKAIIRKHYAKLSWRRGVKYLVEKIRRLRAQVCKSHPEGDIDPVEFLRGANNFDMVSPRLGAMTKSYEDDEYSVTSPTALRSNNKSRNGTASKIMLPGVGNATSSRNVQIADAPQAVQVQLSKLNHKVESLGAQMDQLSQTDDERFQATLQALERLHHKFDARGKAMDVQVHCNDMIC